MRSALLTVHLSAPANATFVFELVEVSNLPRFARVCNELWASSGHDFGQAARMGAEALSHLFT